MFFSTSRGFGRAQTLERPLLPALGARAQRAARADRGAPAAPPARLPHPRRHPRQSEALLRRHRQEDWQAHPVQGVPVVVGLFSVFVNPSKGRDSNP